MENWYKVALLKAKDQLSDNSSLDGFSFLQDYYLDNEELFEADYDIEGPDDFAEKHLINFQEWMSENDGSISVSETGRWSFSVENSSASMSQNELATSKYQLSKEEESLLSMNHYELDAESYIGLRNLVSRLSAQNDNRVVGCSIKLARAAEKSGKNDNELLDLWLSAKTFCKKHPESGDIITCFKEMAYYYVKMSKYKDAALIYYDAARSSDNNLIKVDLLRSSRIQYQNAGDHESASSVFVEKMNIKRKDNKFLLWLFWFTSNYGESPIRVFFNILLWLALLTFSLCFFIDDYNYSGEKANNIVDAFYYSFVTFTTLGYGDITPSSTYGRVFSGIISFLGLLYTSLLMVTIVRKYSRS